MTIDILFCCLAFGLGLLAMLFDMAVLLSGLVIGWIN